MSCANEFRKSCGTFVDFFKKNILKLARVPFYKTKVALFNEEAFGVALQTFCQDGFCQKMTGCFPPFTSLCM